MARLLFRIVSVVLVVALAACGGAVPASQPTAAPTAVQPTNAPDSQPTPAPTATQPTPAPTAAQPATPQKGGEATIGLNADILNFNGNQLSFVNYPIFRQCYNRLVKYDLNMQPQPELATSWSWSDDNLTLTLNLRKGVKFHNGREFVANDVVQAFAFASAAETGANLRPRMAPVAEVTAPDDYTVVIKLSQVTPNFIDTLDSLSIMAPESFETIGQGCIGTGPFRFVEWIPGDRLVFERNPEYWEEGLPYLDRIVFRPFTDAEALSAALETGRIDGAVGLAYRDFARLSATNDIQRGYPGATLYVLILNPPDPGKPDNPLSNKLVRQAIHYATDRQAIIDQALFGVGEATVLPFPENSLAFFSDLGNEYTYDPDRARQLLSKAGFAGGVELEAIVSIGFPELVDAAQILQADLAQIGVKLNVVPLENAVWTPRLLNGDYQVTFSFIGRSHKDPLGLFDNSPFRIVNSPVWPGGDFPEGYVDNLQLAASTNDENARRQAFRKLQEIMLDQSVQIPLSWRYTLFGQSKSLKGMSWTVDDEVELKKAWIER